jgi:ABC-type phosphate transport system substrate-binding protein
MPGSSIRSRLVFVAVAVAVAVVAMTTLPARAGADQPTRLRFQIVVHPSNPVTSLDRKSLLEVFFRKTTRWPNEQPIRPVDLPTNSPTRQSFSNEALGRSLSAVKAYWLQVIFSGHGVPPPELDSDEQVVSFVARTAGAIGYVSGTAKIEGTKAISLR